MWRGCWTNLRPESDGLVVSWTHPVPGWWLCMVSRAPTYSHACSLHSSRLCLGMGRCPGLLPGQLTWLFATGKWWNKWYMKKEIKYTHQEAQGAPKNADKQSNPGKEYVNKIRLKNYYLLLLSFSIFVSLGLCWHTWAFSSCGKQALLFFVDSRPHCGGGFSCCGA